MVSVFTSVAIFLIDSINCGIDFFVSDFSTAIRTTKQSVASPSWVWLGAISSIVFNAFFNALNLM